MLPQNDPENLRAWIGTLSPYDGNHPTSGRINPYTVHTNVIAAAFMDMPINEYNPGSLQRMSAQTAHEAAVLFMEAVNGKAWPENAAQYTEMLSTAQLTRLLGTQPSWALESVYRNTYELFNPRDTQYAIFLVAQSGIDMDGNRMIDHDEIQGTERAVAYIWRDPETGKSAPCFFGLNESLEKNGSQGRTWTGLLKAFQP